jgi:hypothetical protein
MSLATGGGEGGGAGLAACEGGGDEQAAHGGSGASAATASHPAALGAAKGATVAKEVRAPPARAAPLRV